MTAGSGALLRRLPSPPVTFDEAAAIVVVGTGAAGMSAALEAAAGGADILIISKGDLGEGSTPWAQGGLAAALEATDSAARHAADTMAAGAGLCDAAAVDALVRAAPGEIARLSELGGAWDDGPLGLEGGHSHPRIVHAGGDASGAEVHRVLAAALGAAMDGGAARLWLRTFALDLLLDDAGTVAGLLVGRIGPDGRSLEVGVIHTTAVALASGGFGHAYATTTNPYGLTGDGLGLAVRAGADVCDVEFVQFHPTVLWHPGRRGRRPLITEALRGAGATLVDAHGRPVMRGAHPLGDLAPRDVVAATMQARMNAGDGPATHLWLDASAVGARRLAEEFPTVTASCLRDGIDPATQPIPVAPGAHYACGGIRADMDGITSLDGLFAVGEAASTGVHGANRLASNSLTESLAAGRRVGRGLASWAGARPRRHGQVAVGDAGPGAPGVDPATRHSLAEAMAQSAGVVREAEGLAGLLDLLALVPPAPRVGSGSGALDVATVEATNLHTVSTLVTLAALARTESRGSHRRSDFPRSDPAWQRRLTLRASAGRVEVAVEAMA